MTQGFNNPYDPKYRPPATQKPVQNQSQGVVAAKTPAIAVVLNFFIPGVGNMYAGQTGVGLLYLLFNMFLVWPSVALTAFLGLLWAIPIWILIMVHGYVACTSFNRRNNINVR